MILFIYLLKMVASCALFYGYYFFFLRNKRMHQYNRFYILTSITLSIVLPFIKIPVLSTGNNEQLIVKTLYGIAFGGWENEIVVKAKQGFLNSFVTTQNIVVSIYVVGLLIALYPLIRSVYYIRSLSLQHTARELDNIRLYDTAEPGTPFSFFNTVFWNKNISIETKEGQQILRHELYHIKHKHSYDILFMQLTCSLLWFNPFCFLLIKELKVIHEFLADEFAAAGTDKHHYAELLVIQAVSPNQIFITNQFFYNQIKRRITMILQNNNSKFSYFRKTMAVFVALLIFCACSVKSKDEAKDLQVIKKDNNVLAPPTKDDQEWLQAASGKDEIFTKVEIEPSFPNGAGAWMRYLNQNFRYPMEAQEKEIQGTIIIQFIVDKEGNVSNVEAIKGTTEGGLREEAIRVIKNSGKWDPAVQNGRKVNCYKRQPITFKLEAE